MKLARIGKEGNVLFLLDSNNKKINGQIFIRIHDEINETPTAVVKVLIDLDNIIDLDNE